MKKIILFITVILFGNSAISQQKTYLLFEFMKVSPFQELAYLEAEDFWEKIHDQRIKNGEMIGWQLWRFDDGNSEYQYITIQVFNDADKMFRKGAGISFLDIAKKAFPKMSDSDLIAKRNESLRNRELVETIFLEKIDDTMGKFDLNVGAIMGINFMKVSPDNIKKYENAELTIFKPEWQNRVDSGRTGNWSLLKIINPNDDSNTGRFSYVSMDRFNNSNQINANSNNYNTIRSASDQKAWQEALAMREINPYRTVLIKKTGKDL